MTVCTFVPKQERQNVQRRLLPYDDQKQDHRGNHMLSCCMCITVELPVQEKHCVDGLLSSEFVFMQLMMEKRVIVLGSVELDGTVLIVLLSLQEGEANE